MSRLWLKLFRDLRAYRAQVIGIGIVTMLGISLFQSFYLSYRSLDTSYAMGFDELKLADFLIEINGAPSQTTHRLATIPGVEQIAGRLNRDIRVEQAPGRRKVVTGRIISVPDEGRAQINKLMVLEGEYLGPPHDRAVLLERGFAKANNYKPGDLIFPVVDGIRRSVRVAGIVSSIEYLYVVSSKENLFATPESFGVMWMRRSQVERLFDAHGMIDEVICLTHDGARDRVMSAMYADLRRFGATPPVPQEEQPSRQLLQMDLDSLGQIAIAFPIVFIGAAALTIFAIVARIVERERKQIGFLRASGLPAWRVGLQYLTFSGLMGLLGVIPGLLLGQWFALVITQMYLDQLGIPFLQLASGLAVALVGTIVTTLASLLAGWGPAMSAAAMKPAEAMQPGSADSLQHHPPRLLAKLQRNAAFTTRTALSNLFRQVHRTAYTVFGVVCGLFLMITTMSLLDTMEYTMGYYFNSVRDYDVSLGFAGPVSDAVVAQVRKWPNVQWAEGNVGLPVILSRDGVSDDYTITGVPRGSRLQTFRDSAGNRVSLCGDGIYPSDTVAKDIDAERGDVLRLEYARNSREMRLERPVKVALSVRQPIGGGIYMSAESLRRQFGRKLGFPPGSISGLVIKAKPGAEEQVAARAYDVPGATVVETTYDLRRQLDASMAIMYVMIGVLMLFAGALTVAIVYNMINSNITERRSEIASLRALGVRMTEITRMVTIENLVSCLIGILVGVPLGALGARGAVSMLQSETMSFDFYLSPRTFMVSIIFSVVLVIICQIPPLRSIAGMNLAQTTRLHGE